MAALGSYCGSFFRSVGNCASSVAHSVAPYLPDAAEVFSAAYVTATTYIQGPAMADLGITEYVAYPLAYLIAMQTSFAFRRPEFVKHAKEFAEWSLGKPLEEKTEETPGCKTKVKNVLQRIGTACASPIIGLSFASVPLSTFALAKYQVKQFLLHEDFMQLLFNSKLEADDKTVIALSVLSGIFAVYYSMGTEGAAAYKWFEEKHPGTFNCVKNNCGSCCCPGCLPFAKLLAGLGAGEHSIRETGALLSSLVEHQKLTTRAEVIVVAIISILIMGWQNTTFQGREFQENFKQFLEYIENRIKRSNSTELVSPTATNYSSLANKDEENQWVPNIEWSKCQKVALGLIDTLLIIGPSVAAHFSLAYLSLRENSSGAGRAVLAAINTAEETSTETVNAVKDFHKSVARCCL